MTSSSDDRGNTKSAGVTPSAAKDTVPPLPWRAVRYVVWLCARRLWQGLRRLGLPVPVRWLVFHPLDRKTALQVAEGDRGRLLVVCDLANFPLSYDAIFLYAAADQYRRSRGLSVMDVVVVSHATDPLMREASADNPIGGPHHRDYVFNLALEGARLFAATGSVLFFNNRALFVRYWRAVKNRYESFPSAFDPLRPDFTLKRGKPPLYGMVHVFGPENFGKGYAAALRPPDHTLDLVRAWAGKYLGGRPFVTITLRQTPYRPRRNSRIEVWQKVVEHYAGRDFMFVVLGDYTNLFGSPAITGENVIECPEAVMHLTFRAALYQIAIINLFTNSGPAGLCYFNPETRYISFAIGTDEPGVNAEDMQFLHGIGQGESLPGSGPFQKLVWEPESSEVICAELDALLDSR